MRPLALLFAILPVAASAVEWWERPTICRPSGSLCYPAMSGGLFLTEGDDAWDADAACRGKKRVCANAIVDPAYDTEYLTKAQISDPATVSSDFDIGAMNAASTCWGARKTKNSGTNAMVAGEWANVWCDGAVSDTIEPVAAGFIASAEPTCADLRDNEFAGVLNGSCYGKKFAAAKYYIECGADKISPARIAVLNGAAAYNYGATGAPGTSATQDGANETFEKMIANAAARRAAAASDN